MRIGVLSTQGDVAENVAAAREALGASGSAVRVGTPQEIDAVDALIIPGGESTAIGPLSELSGAMRAIARRSESDSMPVLGICAGLALIAASARDRVAGSGAAPLGLIDVDVERNSFGRQRSSFEASVSIPALGVGSIVGAFIRAPTVSRAGDGVEVLARLDDRIVAVRQGASIGVSFHAELGGSELHRGFARVAAGAA